MSKKGKSEIKKVQRKTALRISSAYSTVSAEAANILADLPPIDLTAMERRNIYIGKKVANNIDYKNEARRNLINQ